MNDKKLRSDHESQSVQQYPRSSRTVTVRGTIKKFSTLSFQPFIFFIYTMIINIYIPEQSLHKPFMPPESTFQ